MLFCCKQKTAYEMRISDWSSDVCSSDLVIGRMKADFVDPAAMQVECGKFGREAVGLHPHVENLFRPHSFAQRSQRGLYPAAAVALRSLPQSIVREVEIISGKWTRLVRHLMSAKMSRGSEYGHGEAS